MARTGTTKRYFNFIGGKHSDGSALAPPENTARILQNVDLYQSGKIGRRLGLDFEENFARFGDALSISDLKNAVVDIGEWFNVANSAYATYLIVRVANKIFVIDEGSEPISAAILAEIDISTYLSSAVFAEKQSFSFASGKGKLFCACQGYEPFYIYFDIATQTFLTKKITVNIRDTSGIDDGLANDNRPATLSEAHFYNLKNQGWTTARINSFKSSQGVYPSNADLYILGFTVNTSADKVWKVSEIVNSHFGTSLSARGRYIIDAFLEDRRAASGISSSTAPFIPTNGTLRRPRAVAFFSGRVWLGSVDGRLFFSQIIESDLNIDRFYQEQDPTAEEFNELVATDGGFISIPDIGEVVSMQNISDGLLVFATGGIWKIAGGDNGFTATDAVISKISNVRISNGSSIVVGEGQVFLWAEEGIFVVGFDARAGSIVATNISRGRIDRDFFQIPARSRLFAQGAYDRIEAKVYWSYHDGLLNQGSSLTAKYNSVLIYDTTLNAFWDYRIEDLYSASIDYQPFMAGMIKRSAINEGTGVEVVTVNAADVTVNGETVTVDVEYTGSTNFPISVLAFDNNGGSTFQMTFAEFNDRGFIDWKTSNGIGVNYQSIIETNPETLGDSMLDKQTPYLFVYADYKRDGYGGIINTPRFETSDGFRVTQHVLEIVRKGFPKLAPTQHVLELVRRGEPALRNAQHVLEIVRENS